MRSHEQIITSATEHFAAMAEWAARGTSDITGANNRALGAALVPAILAVPEGEPFSPWEWLDTTEWAGQQTRVGQMLPYLCGSLQVLDMEFSHPAFPELLPLEVVADVMKAEGGAVPYEGQELTTANVELRFRRTVESPAQAESLV